MENQVLSLEFCKKFKELGIEIKTEFYWVPGFFNDYFLMQYKNIYQISGNELPAPTLSELIEIVPVTIYKNGREYWFELSKSYDEEGEVYCSVYVNFENSYLEEFIDKSPIEAVGKLIIYLKENNLI